MTEILLPTVNFDSTPGYNEFRFLHDAYSREFFYRSLISCTPGIVDRSGDPAAAPFETTRPLFVSVNSANSLSLDITSGYAITPNHRLIVVNENLSAVPLPDITADRVYVVGIEYKLVASSETRLNRFGTPAEVRLERPTATPYGGEASTLANALVVVNINDYFNASLYSEERKQNIVILGVVTARSDAVTSQLSLEVDLTRTLFTFNRPWFTTEDTEHRSRIGSGLVTDNNPHATELQDLSSAGFTLYQQLLVKGGVYSKDSTYYGYPGTFCEELVTVNRYEVDETGDITAEDDLDLEALRGRYFVTLAKVPVRVGSLYKVGEPWKPIPYYWKPGTRYLILGTLEQPLEYGVALTFQYFSVNALMPPFESLAQGVQDFEVGEPIDGLDYIVSGGLALSELAQTSLSLTATCGPIKKAYRMLCDRDGTLILDPQPLVSILKVVDLVAQTTVQVNQAPLNGFAVPLTIGLTRATESLTATPGFELNLKIRIAGTDQNDSTITEDITFKASQWTEQGSSLEEEPLMFRRTKQRFTSITSVQRLNTVSDPDNAGSDALLTVWAEILQASETQELANISSFFWDGQAARRVRDQRVIATSVQRPDQRSYRFPQLMPESDASFVQELFSVILDPPLTDPLKTTKHLALELDDDRYFAETWKTFSSVDTVGLIKVLSYALVTPGTTLTLTDGKVLTFLNGTVDPDIGEVQIPTSSVTGDVEIKNSIVSTVNNPKFDSTWFAEAGNTDVSLSRVESSIDGFFDNKRKKMTFSAQFILGTIDFNVNGTPISTVTSTLVHDNSLAAVVVAVNNLEPTTGVNAVVVSGAPYSFIVFNGPSSGVDFTVSTPVFSAANSAPVTSLTSPFSFTQPTGGALTADHLPDRFLSEEKEWHYLSRAIPWLGVGLQASLSFSGDVATNIQNLDQAEIVPGKILVARRGVPSPSIDRSIGEFLVTDSSLLLTLESIVATINHTGFNSGVRAALNDTNTAVLITIGGYAQASFTLLLEAISGTWVVQDYTPIGGSDSIGFMKTIYPLAKAEWRYQTIDQTDPTVNHGPGNWSPWESMDSISKTAWKFDGPLSFPLYAIQLRLLGPKGKANGFSLYQLSPEVSATNTGLDTRLQIVEADMLGAEGTSGSLANRLLPTINLDGSRVQDTELTAARDGTVTPTQTSLKNRLDVSEGQTYWLTGSADNYLDPTALGNIGVPNRLINGVKDGQDNSNFFAPGSPSASTLTISASSVDPLVLTLKGNYYRIARNLEVDFTGLPSSLTPYFVFAEIKSKVSTFLPAAVNTAADQFTITDHGLVAGDNVTFSSSGTLPAGLTAGTTYYVNVAASTTFEVSATYGGSSVDLTTTGTGTHTVTVVNQEMGRTVYAGFTTAAITSGANILQSSLTFSLVNTMIAAKTPLVLHIPSLATGTKKFFSPISSSVASNQVQIFGEFPANVPLNTYFEIRSYREPTFAVSTTRAETAQRLCIGQVVWNGAAMSDARCYRYLEHYKSTIKGPYTAPLVGSITPVVFDHNLGRIPTNYTLLYHSVSTGDATPTVIQAELIAKVDSTTLTVVNRYDNVLARVFGTPPTAATTGYIQLII